MFRKKEKGFALILSLILLLAMSLMGGALIVISSGDHRSNNNSDQYQQVFYVAETGLMQGEKWVIDNYLGHWMTTVPPAAESLGPPPIVGEDDKTEVDVAEYDVKVEEYNRFTALYTPGARGYFRHTFDRGPARNDTVIASTAKSTCMKSFKNIDANRNIMIAGKGNLPKKENFINIVGPLLLNDECENYETCDSYKTENLEEKDKIGWNDTELTKIVKSEIAYLKRFEYEFFVVNSGSAAYRAEGSSIATNTSNIDTQGTAYKIYSCGIFYGKSSDEVNWKDEDDEDDKDEGDEGDEGEEEAVDSPKLNDGKIQILIPLETLIVMPN